MTLVVPFDGSELSEVALVRAAQFESVLNERVLAVSVIPTGNAEYARARGWLRTGEPFDAERIVDTLRASVAEIHPDAEYHHTVVDRRAPRGTIAKALCRFARDHEASIVFLGSENAGRVVSGFTVGRSVAADDAYDTMIVSAVRPSNSRRLEAAKPTTEVLKE
ncbi:universal stress protein [Haloplanus salilacus]|uniref:universal stress protein n=1 Tax=Haloplanus salilacus TaxID=2949994 RepID=UPI0030D127A6